MATQDQTVQTNVLKEIAGLILQTDLRNNPAAVSTPVYHTVSRLTGVADPYKKCKARTNAEARRLLPELQKIMAQSGDSLQTALHLAAAGNIIDLGIGHAYDLRKDILEILEHPFAIDDTEQLLQELKPGRHLLYLGDNAGEIVFDSILVNELLKTGIEITFAVKSSPIINDAMMEDAVFAGLTESVRVIETGSGDIGVNPTNACKAFRNAFDSADILLGKGHGSFETCVGMDRNIFFLLKAKCDVVAGELGVKKGDIVFKHQKA
jgi:uncharacterized protein with ATP-grasp and redox domains